MTDEQIIECNGLSIEWRHEASTDAVWEIYPAGVKAGDKEYLSITIEGLERDIANIKAILIDRQEALLKVMPDSHIGNPHFGRLEEVRRILFEIEKLESPLPLLDGKNQHPKPPPLPCTGDPLPGQEPTTTC